jgi:hypothetical protein
MIGKWDEIGASLKHIALKYPGHLAQETSVLESTFVFTWNVDKETYLVSLSLFLAVG